MTGQRARDLEAAYSNCLKKQIVDQGSSLPCKDENFSNEVEELLKNEDGHNTHCLGLDTFNIMEESLRSAGTDGKRATKVRTGLNGLAKAFEVLEQAALNLYLGPWREEYKVVKMYSGIFTHCIKPVFSTQQIELLFGLLGYKKCSTQREQLRLVPQRSNATSMDELLRLSCAFFVGRCECRLLLAALGKHAGQPQWELSVVRERLRGCNLETALDNALRKVDVKHTLQELPEESEMDLYTAEQDDEEQTGTTVDESPRSLTWMPNKSANGVHREPSYFSAHHQNSEVDSTANSFSSISRYVYKETSVDKNDALPINPEEKEDTEFPCTCLTMTTGLLYTCTECQIYHHRNCPKLEPCQRNHRGNVEYVHEIPEHFFTRGAAASERKRSLSPTLTRSSGALSSLTLQDKSESYSSFNVHHLAMHDCVDERIEEPKLLCFTCQVFHTDFCNDAKNCLSSHQAKKLGWCSVEKCCKLTCVTCKYCGNEYCKECWYINPINCRCGQTFDFSSSV